jgi:hypothetical protein
MPPKKQKRYNFSSRKQKFTRERDRSNSPSDEELVTGRERGPYIPPSPPRWQRRSARHTKERPTCLLFGTYREFIYPDHFFCHPCKMYEDLLLSGSLHGLANRNSRHYRCTANHTDCFFPTHLKVPDFANAPVITPQTTENSGAENAEIQEEENTSAFEENTLLEDFRSLQVAFEGCQEMLRSHTESQEQYLSMLKDGIREHLTKEVLSIASYVEELQSTITALKEQINVLQTHLNYYKKRLKLIGQ